MAKRQRRIAVLLAVLTVLALGISAAFLLHEAGHDCIGEGCPICRQIAAVRVVFEALAPMLWVVLAVAAVVRLLRLVRPLLPLCTPIRLKVKLLD